MRLSHPAGGGSWGLSSALWTLRLQHREGIRSRGSSWPRPQSQEARGGEAALGNPLAEELGGRWAGPAACLRAVSAAAVPATQPSLPFPVLPKAAQLLLVHPAPHPGHRPVPNPPACPPSGQCSFSQGSYSQREAGKGSASSKVHAGGRPEGPSLSFPTPKRVGEGQSWRTGPELWNGRAGSPQGVCPHTQILSPRAPQPPALPQPGGR